MLVPIAASDAATADVETVAPGETARVAARRLRATAIGSLVVVEDGAPVGIVTETDLVGVLAGGDDPDATTVGAVMSAPLVTVDADADLRDAARLFADHGVKKLPVLDDGALVGILTTTDVSYYLPRLAGPAETTGDASRSVRRNVHSETAYERPAWRFEYVGDDDGNGDGGNDGVSVGDAARFSKPLTDDDVRAFADATGDTNRLHLDDAFAAETRFGRRIVHGSLSTGIISAALARLPGLTIYLSKELQFLGPVDVGDRVVADCRVVEHLGGGRYRLDATVGVDPAGEGEDAATAGADDAGSDDDGDGEHHETTPSIPPVDEAEAVVSGSVTVLIEDAPDVTVEGEETGDGVAPE